MKILFKKSAILLIFFFAFLFRESIYGVLLSSSNLPKINQEINNIKGNYYEKEYNSLLKFINMPITNEYNYQISKVLYRDIYDYFNTMTILVDDAKIKENQAVMNEFGLIGTISKINKNSAEVKFITHKKNPISIKVNNSYGILEYQNNNLRINSIHNYEKINIGDIVYTSGIGTLPAGIKIGEIKEIKTDELGIEKEIIVTPYVDFDNINYVAILIGDKK